MTGVSMNCRVASASVYKTLIFNLCTQFNSYINARLIAQALIYD